ncbi:hypothetical protein V8F33_002923 [Rhypophila sp. PSN 637]
MASFSPEYHALAAMGRDWYDAQVRVMNDHGVHDDATLPAIPPHYTFDTSAPGLPGVVDATSSNLNQLGHWDEDRFVELKDADEAVAQDVGSIYESYVHVGGKAIICTSIHKDLDRYNDTPGQIFFGQFLATACSSVSRLGGRDGEMRGLEAIWCYWVESEQTERIVEEIFRARQVQTRPSVDVCVGSDDFFALLATQNGKSLARMLGA